MPSIFASLLLAIGLDGLASGLTSRTPLPRAAALAIVLVLLIAFLTIFGVATIPRVVGQLNQLWDLMARDSLTRSETRSLQLAGPSASSGQMAKASSSSSTSPAASPVGLRA